MVVANAQHGRRAPHQACETPGVESDVKYALVSGKREEAQPSLSGTCPACGHAMVAKCGEVRMWHWAHQGKRFCDPWWENEGEWHRKWKAQFPDTWQEIVHPADNGLKHIADVKTEHGWVIEFQHSYLKPGVRRSRDGFYEKLIWVVNGTRRKRDEAQFVKALNDGVRVGPTSNLWRVWSDECALLREWTGSRAPVFFDFGGEQVLWWLLAGRPDAWVYVVPYSRADFIEIQRGGVTQMARDFDELIRDVNGLVSNYEAQRDAQVLGRASFDPLVALHRATPRRRL